MRFSSWHTRVFLLFAWTSLSLHAALGPEQAVSPVSYQPAANEQWDIAVASSGSEYLTVWRDDRQSITRRLLYPATAGSSNGDELFGSWIGLQGERDTLPNFRIPGHHYSPRLAWVGSHYLLMSTDAADVFVRKVAPYGRPGALQKIGAFPDLNAGMDLVAHNGGAVAVWSEGNADVKATVLGPNGDVQRQVTIGKWSTGKGTLVSLGDDVYYFYRRRRCEAFTCPYDVVMTSIDPAGSTERTIIANSWGTIGVATDGRNFLVINQDEGYGGPSRVLQTATSYLFDRQGQPVRLPVRLFEHLASNTSWSFRGDVAWDGTSYLTYWTSDMPDTRDFVLFARRVDADGTPLDAEPFEVARGPLGGQNDAVLASSGQSVLMAWADARQSRAEHQDVVAVVVRSFEELRNVPPQPLLVSQSGAPQNGLALASDEQTVLGVWREGEGTIAARRFSKRGAPVGPARILVQSDGTVGPPAVTSMGSQYVVFWTELQTFDRVVLRGLRVTAAGRAVGEPVDLDTGCRDYDEEPPSVASNGSVALMAWRLCESSVSRLLLDSALDVLDREVTPVPPRGSGFEPQHVPPQTQPFRWSPQVVWDGQSFTVLYFESLYVRDAPRSVYLRATQVAPDGATRSESSMQFPSVGTRLRAVASEGRTLAAWSSRSDFGSSTCLRLVALRETGELAQQSSTLCSPDPARTLEPSLAAHPGGFEVVVSETDTASRLHRLLVSRRGTVLNATELTTSAIPLRRPTLIGFGFDMLFGYDRIATNDEVGWVSRAFLRREK